MSNALAIATVTAALRRMLTATVGADVTGATATAVRPNGASTTLPDPGVNLYLYQVTPNATWRNSDLPTRNGAGEIVQRPRIALDLHYLFTFYGDESELLPQRVLGSVARTLHARPNLDRDTVRNTILDPTFSYVADSDLAEEVEIVKLTPGVLSLEELSKLWSVLFQTTYALSMTYIASVVMIEAEETPRRPLPVRERVITVSLFRRAVIDRVVAEEGESEPIEMDGTILIQGSRLDGPVNRVRVGVADLQPVPDSVTPFQISVALTDNALRAGVQGVQVVYENGCESNAAALVLRPKITVDSSAVTASEVPISFNPPVGRVQRVTLFLNELNPPATRAPFAYSFDAPAENGISAASVEETTDITFAISGVHPGTYLVRVSVGGAENVLGVDLIGGKYRYNEPTATIP